MRPKICIKGRLIISSKFFIFLEEGGGSRLMMTKCEMGVGGLKFSILRVTYFLHGPLLSKRISWQNIQNSQTYGQNTLKIVNFCLLLAKKRLRKNFLVPMTNALRTNRILVTRPFLQNFSQTTL